MAAALLTSGLLVGLAACGDDASSGDGDAGGTVSLQGGSTTALTKDSFAQTIRAAQAAAGSAHVEATVESQGQTLELGGDVNNLDTPEAPEIDFSADIAGQEMRLLVVDKALYVTGGGLTGTQDKKWMKIDVSDPTNPLGQIFQAANPSNFSAYLEGVTGFADQGEESIDGVATTHYSVTVDTGKMLAANPVFKGQDTSMLGLPKSLTSEVYVDTDNRPVEIKVDLGATGAFEAHFSDYGKDVSIAAPPADHVGKFSLGD